MKKQTILLALGLWFNFAYAQQKNDQQIIADLDKILSDQFKSNEPGATALVSRKGKIIYQKSFGMANMELNIPMKTDHVFLIGSLTKQFTAVAILQLIEQGKLNLQDEITKFIPDYPTQGAKITIEHLLTHTSGIHNYTAMKDYTERMMLDFKPIEMIDHFKNEPLRFIPGTKWEYSNSNYFLLGYIIEILSRKTYPEYLEEYVFKPAGMTKSLYASDIKLVKHRVGAYSKAEGGFENAQPLSLTQPYAAGSIQSTVEDLFKWNQALNSNKLIKKESLSKAYTNYKLVNGKESNYGYGFRFGNNYENPSIWHGGRINGFATMEIYLPKEDVFVVLLSNCDCTPPLNDLTAKMAAIATGKTFEYKEIAITNNALQEYPGVYENSKGHQRIITISENKLYSKTGRSEKSNLKSYQKDQFFINTLQTIEFARNEKGEIEKLVSKNLNGNDIWIKTNKSIPEENGIKLDGKILEAYVGSYEVTPEFSFAIIKEQDRLFLQAPEQEKLEMFAETESKFFLKVNDAEFVFVKDDAGTVVKSIMTQGGREAEAKKIK